MASPEISTSSEGPITTISINRNSRRNAIDGKTATLLYDAFLAFERDPDAKVAVLHGEGESFCAGADLHAIASTRGQPASTFSTPSTHSNGSNPLEPVDTLARPGALGPMGPTRLLLSKPVIAAIHGYAVAGGMELALWCDLRVASSDAVLGVFCRRWGVPLIDGGTVRLPRLIGLSRALDLILTGRPVNAEEALRIGLVNRVVDVTGSTQPGAAVLTVAQALARQLAAFPQACLRADRLNAIEQQGKPVQVALACEFDRSLSVVAEAVVGAGNFSQGEGRHGSFAGLRALQASTGLSRL